MYKCLGNSEFFFADANYLVSRRKESKEQAEFYLKQKTVILLAFTCIADILETTEVGTTSLEIVEHSSQATDCMWEDRGPSKPETNKGRCDVSSSFKIHFCLIKKQKQMNKNQL